MKLENLYSISNYFAARRVQDLIIKSEAQPEELIAKRIVANKPLLFGRLGGLEASVIGIYLNLKNVKQNPIRAIPALILRRRRFLQLINNAGVYPINKSIVEFFCEQHLSALQDTDLLSVWAKPFAWAESIALDHNVVLVSGDYSFPWLESRDGISQLGWAHSFSGKKILVISPFTKSISVQINKMEKIFASIKIPNMYFELLQAPLTQGGLNDGKNYKIHLTEMKNQMMAKEFDIALISAGGYSLPLAHFAKKSGKIGIHAGGAMQIFFGITGRRYDSYSQVLKFINENWKRPYDFERPANWQSIEGGCYW